MTRPGYAIEYDFFDPRDLSPTLETKPLARLFFAGQINGSEAQRGHRPAGATGRDHLRGAQRGPRGRSDGGGHQLGGECEES